MPFDALALPTTTMYFRGEGFEKTTSCITAYISLERCLCVLFPLHVKRFVTPRITAVVVMMIFGLMFVPSNLGYLYSINKAMLFIVKSQNPHFRKLAIMLTYYINSVVLFTALISIWICSVFIVVTFKQNAQNGESKFGQISTNVGQIRNRRVIFWPPHILFSQHLKQ